MKKALTLLLALAMAFALVACGGGTAGTSSPPPSSTPSSSAPSSAPPSSSASTSPAPVLPSANTPQPTDKPARVVDSISFSPRDVGWSVAPWMNNGNAGNSIWTQLYSCLLANPMFGSQLKDMINDMADSITFSADNLTATVKLRDYIHDSKGNPIKAEDVVFSYQTAPTVSASYAFVSNNLGSATAIDPLTVELKAKQVVPGTWENLLANVPIVSKTWYQGASDDERATDPATTGAYKVQSHVTGGSTTLVALDNFWQKDELRTIYQTVNVKTINYVGVVESSMRTIALENGELDAIFIDINQVDKFLNDPNYICKEVWTTNPGNIVLNGSDQSPFYNNPALRKAILYGVDWRQVAVPIAGTGFARGYDVAPILSSNYDKAWDDGQYYEYDPDLAKQYLADAGYPGGKGLRTLTMNVRNNAPPQAAATIVQSYLKELGIDLTFGAPDQPLYLANQTDPTAWDIELLNQSMASGFVTEAWIYYYGPRGDGGNASFVKDPQMQTLLDAALKNNDTASLNAFHDYANDQAYAINAFNEHIYYVMRKDITSFPISFMTTSVINACTFSDSY